jgi:enterobactin synthetase component D
MDLTTLFPPPVALVLADTAMWLTPLRTEEEALIQGAVEKRQREFRAGRHAAHAALDRLKAPDGPILRGEKREPLWPDGFIGSIAHCREICLAACASTDEILGLGLDVEPRSPLPEGVDRYIQTPQESDFMRRHRDQLSQRLIFSAKESLYKCYYPLVKRFFGFQSVNLTIDTETASFDFRPTPRCEIEFPRQLIFRGRYLDDGAHLYTACCLSSG